MRALLRLFLPNNTANVRSLLYVKYVEPIEIHHHLTEEFGESCVDVKIDIKWWRVLVLKLNDEQRSGRL